MSIFFQPRMYLPVSRGQRIGFEIGFLEGGKVEPLGKLMRL